jgi:hypothetical protein
MEDVITLPETRRPALASVLLAYAADRREVAGNTEERAMFQAIASRIGMAMVAEAGPITLDYDDRLACGAALTSRIYGARDAAWRAAAHGNFSLETSWRRQAAEMEDILRDITMRAGPETENEPPDPEAVGFDPATPDELHVHYPG